MDIFAPDHNDPFAVTFIFKKLKAGVEFTFTKNGETKGKILRLVRASGRWTASAPMPVVISGFYSMSFGPRMDGGYSGGETLSAGECGRLKITKRGNGFDVSLYTLQS